MDEKDTHVHFPCAQADATIIFVLSFVKTHCLASYGLKGLESGVIPLQLLHLQEGCNQYQTAIDGLAPPGGKPQCYEADLLMPQKMKIEKLLISLAWLASGFVSWLFSTYLFTYILSPILIDIVRETNAITQSVLMKTIANMLFTKSSDFTVCFLFAMALGFFTKYTKLRLSLFVFGMVGISLYIQVEGFMDYIAAYSELPSWVITFETQGLVALLLIIPIISVVGSRLGNYMKMRRTTSIPAFPAEREDSAPR